MSQEDLWEGLTATTVHSTEPAWVPLKREATSDIAEWMAEVGEGPNGEELVETREESLFSPSGRFEVRFLCPKRLFEDEGNFRGMYQVIDHLRRRVVDCFWASDVSVFSRGGTRSSHRKLRLLLPAAVAWSPRIHVHFPKIVKQTVLLLLIARQARVTVWSLLPRDICFLIFEKAFVW